MATRVTNLIRSYLSVVLAGMLLYFSLDITYLLKFNIEI